MQNSRRPRASLYACPQGNAAPFCTSRRTFSQKSSSHEAAAERSKRGTLKKEGTEGSSSIHEAIEILAPASFANVQKDQCSKEGSNGEKALLDELVTDDTSVSCNLRQPKLTFCVRPERPIDESTPFFPLFVI